MPIRFAKVKDHDNLIKDFNSGAVLNTDMSSIARHNKRTLEIEEKKRREEEINSIKSDIAEIRHLLQKLIKD